MDCFFPKEIWSANNEEPMTTCAYADVSDIMFGVRQMFQI